MNSNKQCLISLIESLGCDYTLDAIMSEYTTFKIGGPAEILAVPETQQTLRDLVCAARENEIPCFILGKGSNLLVNDGGINGLVISTGSLNNISLIDEITIKCECGAQLSRLCNFALENGLSGLEFAYGIPGSAGGAAYMNAGAYGGEMKDVLLSCRHITPYGELGSLEGDNMGLSYRHSAYCTNYCVITELTLRLSKGSKDEIKAKMNDFLSRRKDKQPLDFPSAGSTFKRPDGYFAGALIEQCGLKGFSVGGAAVSEKHAGFVINKNGATCSDVLHLIEHIKTVVLKETGVSLEAEIKII